MKEISVTINSEFSKYSVVVGENILKNISQFIDLNKYSNIFVLTDEKVLRFYQHTLNSLFNEKEIFIHAVKEGEESKSITTYAEIVAKLIELKLDRKALMINMGGGMVTDLGGFAASTYQRGIDFLNISTSVEGMVDASIGGKNGINIGSYKNYVGTFNQPIAVIIDVKTLETLDDRNFAAGWAEIIKHGLIYDLNYFNKVTSKKPREFTNEELIEIISRSCEIKKAVVEEDEKEGGKRKILNFGHTIGHAIESVSFEYERLLHGEAIAIGMVAEAYISFKLGYISENDLREIKEKIEYVGLPTRIPFQIKNKHDLTELVKKDKKNVGGKIKWSLIKPLGECIFDVEVEDEIMIEAMNQVLN